jgi:hypothetical protein
MSIYRLDHKASTTKVNNSNNNNGSSSSSNNTTTAANNNDHHKKKRAPIDGPLPRAPHPGNFNINYSTFEVRIPNYTFRKAIELAGAGGLLAVSLGIRYDSGQKKMTNKNTLNFKFSLIAK